MRKLTLGILISLTASSAAFAGNYSVELNAGGSNTDYVYDSDDSEKYIGGSVYFAPVSTDGKPLAEAAFLNRASNIYGKISHVEDDFDDATVSELGVEIYLPNSIFYGAFDYKHAQLDGRDNDDQWSAKLGITPVEGLLLTTSFIEDVDYDPNITAKYVYSMPGGQAISFNGMAYFADETLYSLGADYHVTPQTSFGFEYADVTDAPDSVETISLNAKHFFNESFYVAGKYTENDTADEFGLELGLRF